MHINKKKIKFPSKLLPYKGVILFFVVLFISHFFWKFTVLGDESDDVVTFFGMNISAIFNAMADHVAWIVYHILSCFGYDLKYDIAKNVLSHGNGIAVRIVWACTGLKQAYIFFCIIAFAAGPILKKMWYIPAGLVVVYLFNIFRIAAIVAIIKYHPQSFDFWHEQFFKYAFYGVIFLMWVLWEDKIRHKEQAISA